MANIVLFSTNQIADILYVSDKQLYLRNDYYAYSMRESVGFRSFSGPYFPAFVLNTERFSTNMRTRKSLNTGTFHEVIVITYNYMTVII